MIQRFLVFPLFCPYPICFNIIYCIPVLKTIASLQILISILSILINLEPPFIFHLVWLYFMTSNLVGYLMPNLNYTNMYMICKRIVCR